MSKVRMALLYSSGSLYVYQLISLFFSMYVARVLTPTEIGLYAIAASITMVSGELKVLGTSEYLIRQKNVTKEMIKASLGLSLLVSGSIGALLVIFSQIIASFYNYDDLRLLLLILSLSFFFSPFVAINGALLRKEMDYNRSMIIGWSSKVANFSLSIYLLSSGYSYYSLAIGMSFGLFIELIMSYLFRAKDMHYIPSLKGIKPIFAFGSITTLTNICKRLSKLSPDLILGKLGTTHDVAIFSRGAGFIDFLSHLILGGLQSIALPYLAKANTEIENLKYAYKKATFLALSLLVPILSVAAVASTLLIVLMFGEQWVESGELARNLAIWLILINLHPFAKDILIAKKMEGDYFILEFINLLLTACIIYFGFQYDLQTISYWLILSGVVYFIAVSTLINKAIKMPLLEFCRDFLGIFLLASICTIVSYFIVHIVLYEYTNLIKLLALAIVMPAIWSSLVFQLKLDIRTEIELVFDKIKLRKK
jgi:O-antigen/teichoic acid export membrane protein